MPEEEVHKRKRWEKRHHLPPIVPLRAEVVWSSQVDSIGEEVDAAYVGNLGRYPSLEDDTTIQWTYPYAWVTDMPRSILRKDYKTGRWVQEKGTGNPKRCLPPIIRDLDLSDYGHEFLYGVGRIEVEETVNVVKALSNAELVTPFHQLPLLRVVKLIEVPVPLKGGGVEVRGIIDAYSEEWVVDDHIRQAQLQKMRAKLQGGSTRDLSDRDVVQLWHDREGFYQISLEHQSRFRNDMALYLDNPILLEVRMGYEDTSITRQGEILQEIFVGYAEEVLGVQIPEGHVFPDVNSFVRSIEVIESEALEEVRLRRAKQRPFTEVAQGSMLDIDLRRLADDFLGDPDKYQELQEVDGIAYFQAMYSSLGMDEKMKIVIRFQEVCKQILQNEANALLLGINLTDLLGAKDTVGALVADQGTAGPFGVEMRASIDDSAETLILKAREVEGHVFQTIQYIGRLAGLSPDRISGAIDRGSRDQVRTFTQQGTLPRLSGEIYTPSFEASYQRTLVHIRRKVAEASGKNTDNLGLADYIREGVPFALANLLVNIRFEDLA